MVGERSGDKLTMLLRESSWNPSHEKPREWSIPSSCVFYRGSPGQGGFTQSIFRHLCRESPWSHKMKTRRTFFFFYIKWLVAKTNGFNFFLSPAHPSHTHKEKSINQSINQNYDAFSQEIKMNVWRG